MGLLYGYTVSAYCDIKTTFQGVQLMTWDWWLTYLLTTIILSLSPGAGAINTMSTGISHGYRGAMFSIAGQQMGLACHIVVVGIGLGTLVSQSVLAFEALKWFGAAYLIWLG